MTPTNHNVTSYIPPHKVRLYSQFQTRLIYFSECFTHPVTCTQSDNFGVSMDRVRCIVGRSQRVATGSQCCSLVQVILCNVAYSFRNAQHITLSACRVFNAQKHKLACSVLWQLLFERVSVVWWQPTLVHCDH